jgi:hypothetical protein
MHPARPDEPDRPGEEHIWISADAEVGDFRQGSPASRWALARYLVGRAIGESVSRTLLLLALVLVALAVASQLWLHAAVRVFLIVVLVLAALAVLLLRWVLQTVLRRLTATDRYGPLERRLRALVDDTRADVRRELRRLGLPSRAITLPLLGLRLAGRRRGATLERLRGFDVGRAVPASRLDELHLLLREATGRGPGSGPGAGPVGR